MLRVQNIKQLNLPTGRVYETPNGKKYPSVTRIVGVINEKKIKEWEERVGIEKANEIRDKASKNGTAFHSLMEETLKNGTQKLKFGQKFFTIYPKLLNSVFLKIGEVYGIEIPLYSDKLECAGTCDLIAQFNGKKSIIDWKTSSHRKYENDVLSYWLQTACYSLMVKELYNIDIEQLVLVINVNDSFLQVFIIEDLQQYQTAFKKLRLAYKNKFGI